MKMIPYDIEKFKGRRGRKNSLYEVLTDFLDSGHKCVKLEDYTHKNAESLRTGLCDCRRRYDLWAVGIHVCEGDIYLTRDI